MAADVPGARSHLVGAAHFHPCARTCAVYRGLAVDGCQPGAHAFRARCNLASRAAPRRSSRDVCGGEHARPAAERRVGRHGPILVCAFSHLHLARACSETKRAARSRRVLRHGAGIGRGVVLHVATDILKVESTAASVRGARRAWTVGLVLAVAIPSIVNAAIIARGYDGGPYLRGDCPYYYYTALALLKDRRFDLSRRLPGGWYQHVNQIALSKNGRPVAKHPVVMPILSLPFVALFGKPGTLLFNVVQCTVLLAVLYLLAVRVAHPFAASAAVVLTYIVSFLPHYIWNYSPDLCATVLLASGTLVVAAARQRRDWICGGVLLGLDMRGEVPVRTFHSADALSGPATLPEVSFGGRRRHADSAVALCAAQRPSVRLPVHDRLRPHRDLERGLRPVHIFAALVVRSAVSRGIQRTAFRSRAWTASNSPITLISLLGFPVLLWRDRRLGATLAVGSMALFLLFCVYDQWNASHYGNRFLMPVVAFAAVPLAALIHQLPLFRRARR